MDKKENKPPTAPVLGLKRKVPAFAPPKFVNPAAGQAFKKPGAPQGKPAPSSAAGPAGAATASSNQASSSQPGAQDARYFSVLYTKFQPGKKLRKNKSWADGILEVKADKKAVLYDPEGKVVSSSTLRSVSVEGLGSGSELVMASWEMEVNEVMDAEKFRTGEAFLKPSSTATAAALAAAPAGPSRAFKPAVPADFKPVMARGGLKAAGAATEPAKATWVHDPQAEGAVVLNRQQWADGNGCDQNGRPFSPVVIDPYMGKHLRPHQVEGVEFMYRCVMGLNESGTQGCILADEMGLGKTLQVLTLIWTLLKQGPTGRPAVRKALVVTPSTLTQNWADEARKWLGNERMRVMVLQPGADGKQQVVDFKHGQVMPVAVTSYETLRKHAADLAGCVDLLVCDEGHRLKSAQGNKTIAALLSLNCHRRILLSGTPIQNNLQEFFSMCDFVCPDVLGSLSVFERVFGAPISKSRDRNATAEEKALGEMRSAELTKRVSQFVLRRTSDVNAKYLPPLVLYVGFCRPSPLQLRLYSSVLGSSSVRKLLSTTGADFGDQALTVLTNLKKICNHPLLFKMDEEERLRLNMEAEPGLDASLPMDPQHSGKMAALSLILDESMSLGDRMVVVSQSTAALDLVQQLCDTKGLKTVRIDGATDVNKRQDIVNSFNLYNVGQVFLLSTTAGGAGLNLVGANRLALLDSHWNPAADLQAMARVWRDGQKKACVVYRLLTTGTIDEKMYQRQRMKGELAATMMEQGGGAAKGGASKAGKGQFSKEELKQLFTLRTNTDCDTFDILQGTKAGGEFKNVSGSLEDAPLAAAVAAGHVSFVHYEKKELSAAAGAAAAAAASAGGGSNGGAGGSGPSRDNSGEGAGREAAGLEEEFEGTVAGGGEGGEGTEAAAAEAAETEAGGACPMEAEGMGGASQLEIEDEEGGSWG